MGNNEFAGRFVEFIFSWVKVLADGLWGAFSGTGKAGGAFFKWFGDHWLILLAVLLVGGVVMDWLIWIIRWRPYWLWFRKKRRVYDEQELDENYAQSTRKPTAPKKRPRMTTPRTDPLFDVAAEPVGQETAPAEESGKDPLFELPEIEKKPKDDVEWF